MECQPTSYQVVAVSTFQLVEKRLECPSGYSQRPSAIHELDYYLWNGDYDAVGPIMAFPGGYCQNRFLSNRIPRATRPGTPLIFRMDLTESLHQNLRRIMLLFCL